MKTIAISLSYKCIQQPHCSFCYHNKHRIVSHAFSIWYAASQMAREFPDATLAWEYNGYNLGAFLMHSDFFGTSQNTMTTMPSVVSKAFCGAIAKHRISAIALSYDTQKVRSADEWVEKARLVQEAGMKVSCNFLIEDMDRPSVPAIILKQADQLNLLALKPTGEIKNKSAVNLMVEYCKGFLPVALDNCLAYQLGYIQHCAAGEDFCHIRPDGKVVDCCFQGDCYLWLQRNAMRITERALDGGYEGNAFECFEYIMDARDRAKQE